MRYEGQTSQIKAVENEIQHNAICFQQKQPRNYDALFGVSIPVETKVFDVMPRKEARLIKVRFFYDSRDGTATMDISNRESQWIRELSCNMPKLLDCLCLQRQQ